MKKQFGILLLSVMALMLVSAPWRNAAAQDGKVSPAIVVTVAPINEQFADIGYLLDAIKLEDENVRFAVETSKSRVPRGIDASKPIGGFAVVDAKGNLNWVVFLGVTNLKQAIADLKIVIASHKEAGDGTITVNTNFGQTWHVKQQGDWLFASDKAANLTTLPMDPAALCGGLAQKFNFAVQVHAGNIPQELKAMLVAKLQEGFKEGMRQQNPNAGLLADVYGASALREMETRIQDTESLMFGLAIDQERKSAYLEGSIVAVEGSQWAQEMAPLSQLKTGFAGLALPGATATLNFTGQIKESDAQRITALLSTIRDPVLQEVDLDDSLTGEEKTAAKDVLGTGIDVLIRTVGQRRLDGGAALLLGDGPGTVTFVAGGYVADGPALDKALRTIVDYGKKESKELRAVQFDADQHAGVTFHVLTYDVPDPEGRKVFGNSVEMAVGIGAESIYFAFGRDTVATLKRAIDGTGTMTNSVPPFKLSVSLVPMFKFAAAVSGDGKARQIAHDLAPQQGKDRVELTVTGVERGMRVRFELQEGALNFLGKSLQDFINKRGGPGD